MVLYILQTLKMVLYSKLWKRSSIPNFESGLLIQTSECSLLLQKTTYNLLRTGFQGVSFNLKKRLSKNISDNLQMKLLIYPKTSNFQMTQKPSFWSLSKHYSRALFVHIIRPPWDICHKLFGGFIPYQKPFS